MPLTITYSPGAMNLVGLTSDQDYRTQIIETPSAVITPGGTYNTVQDRVMRSTISSASDNNCTYNTLPLNLNGDPVSVTWTSLTPNVATISSLGEVIRVSDGNASFESNGLYGKRRFSRTMTRTGGGTVTVFDSYATGSLAKHITDAMTTLINGKTPSDTTLLNYSTFSGDYTSPNVVRNTNNFAASIDLSGMSIFRNEAQNNGYWPAALVSSRHFICANHVTGGGGFSYCWMAPDGSYVKATAIDYYVIPGTDLQVGYLDQAIPAKIKKFKVLPSNYKTYLPSTGSYTLPSLSKRMALGQSDVTTSTAKYDSLRVLSVKMYNQAIGGYGTDTPYVNVPVTGQLDPTSVFAPWEVVLHTGDSSGPSWLLINGEPVLLGHYAEITGSPSIADYISTIESHMNSMALAHGDGTSYSLTKVDLSGFPSY